MPNHVKECYLALPSNNYLKKNYLVLKSKDERKTYYLIVTHGLGPPLGKDEQVKVCIHRICSAENESRFVTYEFEGH